MSLIVKNLEKALLSLLDPNYPDFIPFPDKAVSVAFRWMEAIDTKYAGRNLAVPVLPALAESAGFVLWNGLMEFGRTRTIDEEVPEDLLDQIITAYAISLASAFAPPNVGTPPPGVLDLSVARAYGRAGDNAALARTMAVSIDAYFRTGVVTNTLTGVSTPWS